MDELALVRSRLRATRYSDLAKLAKKTGVPKDTLIKIKYGTTKNSRFATVKKLANHYLKAA